MTASGEIDFDAARQQATALCGQMTRDEKLDYIRGYKRFFLRAVPRLGLPLIYMADASQGIHLRSDLDSSLIDQPTKTTAFPCLVALAATWNPELAYSYARAIGEECRAGGIHILLGPGVNIYRNAQCGRNFEYLGEDPYLTSRMVERYVPGLQDVGVIATLKHFLCNNSDYFRRRGNSIVSDRALREIYLPGFTAGVEAGAMAVMTSYNLLNGEWCGQSADVINGLLRTELGFKGLVMSDWWSIYDSAKTIRSGQDLDMPGDSLIGIENLLETSTINLEQIDRMVSSILTAISAMGFLDRPQRDEAFLTAYPRHEEVALETARESIVLLKNRGVLPIAPGNRILATGKFLHDLPRGGGSGRVEGYGSVSLAQALTAQFGTAATIVEQPNDAAVRDADVVILSVGTEDSEGWDRPFELAVDETIEIKRICLLNPRTIVVINSGSAIGMAEWNDTAAAIVYAWYPGQNGNTALAEILAGIVNPSGKLPFTIEKRFTDSPAYGYLPAGEKLYSGWSDEAEAQHPVFDVRYDEGVFVGYRWYESRGIETLYPFGHGLSYTNFVYAKLATSRMVYASGETVEIEFVITNVGNRLGSETAQIYVKDPISSFPRPIKELKGFYKVGLEPGESRQVRISLRSDAFAFWDPDRRCWTTEPGEFRISVGRSSRDIRLEASIRITENSSPIR